MRGSKLLSVRITNYFSLKTNPSSRFASPRIWIFFLFLFFVFTDCSTSKNTILGTVFVRRGFTPQKKSKHVVFPVQVRSGWLLKEQSSEQKKFVESRSFEKLELAILNYGGNIQEKYNAEKQFRSVLETEKNFTEETGIKIAKQLKGEVAVFTEMTDYGTASGNSILELTVKAMDVDSGSILWKGIFSGKAFGLQDNIDLSILESEIFEQLTNKLIQKTE
ncbi:hypothetical protein [Leptospira ellisii]|uniref:hypothetical protein n=1 Tax=Leptospira ellisii TaxID=2023197 RepID=UPI0013FD1537